MPAPVAAIKPFAAAAANLRREPGTDSAISGGVDAGAALDVTACIDGCAWYQLAAARRLPRLDRRLPGRQRPRRSARGRGGTGRSRRRAGPNLTRIRHTLARAAGRGGRLPGHGPRQRAQCERPRPVVPSPVYANGIYARDAFFAVLGLGDLGLARTPSAGLSRRRRAATGQITTAIPFDPADVSLQPQDDETALLYLIWAGYLHRAGVEVDEQIVGLAWDFVQSHVTDGAYVSLPGRFRYWADCWRLDQPDTITYNQGLYALAARLLAETGLAGVTQADAGAAAARYRSLYRADLGFLPLSAAAPGADVQDVSALLPEFLHRYLLGEGLLEDAVVLSTVDHGLATAVCLRRGAVARRAGMQEHRAPRTARSPTRPGSPARTTAAWAIITTAATGRCTRWWSWRWPMASSRGPPTATCWRRWRRATTNSALVNSAVSRMTRSSTLGRATIIAKRPLSCGDCTISTKPASNSAIVK